MGNKSKPDQGETNARSSHDHNGETGEVYPQEVSASVGAPKKKVAEKAKANWAKKKMVHVTAKKSYARVREELKKSLTGSELTRKELFRTSPWKTKTGRGTDPQSLYATDCHWVAVNSKGKGGTQRVKPTLALIQVELPTEAFSLGFGAHQFSYIIRRVKDSDIASTEHWLKTNMARRYVGSAGGFRGMCSGAVYRGVFRVGSAGGLSGMCSGAVYRGVFRDWFSEWVQGGWFIVWVQGWIEHKHELSSSYGVSDNMLTVQLLSLAVDFRSFAEFFSESSEDSVQSWHIDGYFFFVIGNYQATEGKCFSILSMSTKLDS
ncbi:amidoxime reducing component [Artemisia annua]|uniref:Amidoxime reducing component n=1 Tax=Artemisia annua TaxID=35608 RepID=A0A2U1LKF5_ARTAN|nr:amidoxime reducing component [Artemisia annua]